MAAADDEHPADQHPADQHPADQHPADDEHPGDEHRDALPEDLDVTSYVGPYTFPNNNRRRIPGIIYLVTAAICLALWLTAGRHGGILVNRGFLAVAIGLGAAGLYHLVAGVRLDITETDALVAATREVGFPVGHASAQLGWRGLISRPTWRILLYSAEDPPDRRGLVLVDGVDGAVLGHYVEQNPEDWTKL
ncbi:MAG: hypothetical protein QOG64_2855 [Acidimicrobiaceae bacterium]|jgi:hypothetical protein|nr:hypothetical protein [Acidimicrobiaceae bacterium]